MAEGHFRFGFPFLKRLVRENVYVDKYIKTKLYYYVSTLKGGETKLKGI